MIPMRILRFDSVGSTNDVALGLAREGEPEGTVVVAERQIEGRGRRGRLWWDDAGSLLISMILRPDVPPDEMPRLSFVAAVGAAECIESVCGVSCQLKWPNDLMLGGKKVGGILVEVGVGDMGPAAVVGIGINVAQRSFPPELADTATSLALEGAKCTDPDALLEPLCEHLLASYESYRDHGFEEIAGRWRKYMWGVGACVCVAAEGKLIRGHLVGIDETGALLVRSVDGSTHAIIAADALDLDTDSSSMEVER